MKKQKLKYAGLTALALSLVINAGCKSNEAIKTNEKETTQISQIDETKYDISQIIVIRITDKITKTTKYILCDNSKTIEEYFTSTYIEDVVMKNVIINGKKIENPILLNQPTGQGWIITYFSVLDNSYYINELKTLNSDSIYYFESTTIVKTDDDFYTEEVSELNTNSNLFDESLNDELSISKYNYSKIDLKNNESIIKTEEEIIETETFFLTDVLNIKYDTEFTLKELSNIQNELNKGNILKKTLN